MPSLQTVRRDDRLPAQGFHQDEPKGDLWAHPHALKLANFPGGVLEKYIREHTGVWRNWIVRAEADADIKRAVDVKLDWRAELVHRFSFYADEERKVVAVLFNSNALGHDSWKEAAADPVLHVLDHGILFRPLCEMHHARAVFAGHDLFGVVVEVLTDDQHQLAVVWRILGNRKAGIRRKGDIAGHFLPEITKLVAGVPDVVAGRDDRVLLLVGVVTGAPRNQGGADIRLALKNTDCSIEVGAGPMKVRRRSILLVIWAAGERPVRYFWCRLRLSRSGLCAEHM